MPRHHSPATSPRSLHYLVASDFDLVVGGAGRPAHADPYLPGELAGGGAADLEPVEATATHPGAADGPGFTWPDDMLDTVDGGQLDGSADPVGVAPPMGAGAADGAGFTWPDAALDTALDEGAPDDGAPHMCGTMPPTAGGEPPMTLDGLDDVLPYEATATGDTVGMTDDAGGEWGDILPFEATAVPYDDATAQAQGEDGGDGDGSGHGDGSGNGDGSGGHHGGCNDDGDGEADPQIRDAGTSQVVDPMSWVTTSSPAPAPQLAYDRPAHAADVNTVHPQQVAPQGLDADRLFDWALSPRGPVAGAIGGDFAQTLNGLIDRVTGFIRR